MNTKAIKAMAVVGPEGRISAREVYSMHDSLSIVLGEGERKIKVLITPVKASQRPHKPAGRRKSR